jgi:hypothetical protein
MSTLSVLRAPTTQHRVVLLYSRQDSYLLVENLISKHFIAYSVSGAVNSLTKLIVQYDTESDLVDDIECLNNRNSSLSQQSLQTQTPTGSIIVLQRVTSASVEVRCIPVFTVLHLLSYCADVALRSCFIYGLLEFQLVVCLAGSW